jgi:SAM-dependent methyltransferase
VSQRHLEQAKSAIARSGQRNVQFELARLPDFGMHEAFDLWFSRIVLQHNPPPLMAMILRRALNMLAPGGIAIFQLPTYAIDYRFRIQEYLATDPAGYYDMHVLPQPALFEIGEECGCSLKEIREENSAGTPNWISNWIALRKTQ